jgi:hypothetical protein
MKGAAQAGPPSSISVGRVPRSPVPFMNRNSSGFHRYLIVRPARWWGDERRR